MSTDVRQQIREIGDFQRSERRPVELHELELMVHAESPVVVDGRRDRPIMRRRGVLVVAAAFFAVLLIGLLQAVGSNPSEVADTAPVAPPSDLGVFEPIRGWILYPIMGGDLEAVNPDNPSELRTLELPRETAWAVPVGWSADGSLLALEDEKNGHWAVMDQFGELPLHGPTTGCCLFVGSNWLSPEGARWARIAAGGNYLPLDDSTDGEPRFLDLRQIEGATGFRQPTWSPDGEEMALVVEKDDGMELVVVELDTGAFRSVADSEFAYVRHLAWSPDGNQLLVTAADLALDGGYPTDNPLLFPISSRLFLVNVDDTGRRQVASGYYVATAWSPDGTRIAAIDYSPEGRTIVVMDADGSGQKVLPEIEPNGPFTGLAWHPVP